MTVYVLFKKPWLDIVGIYRQIKDAEDMIQSFKGAEKFIIEAHKIIE